LPAPKDPSAPPEPHIIGTFASELAGRRLPVPQKPVRSVPVRADVDGCNRDYGDAGQCIPNRLPPGQTDLCLYLAEHGMKNAKSRGADRSRIDLNRNGVVCD
jgi:hypothetical protein